MHSLSKIVNDEDRTSFPMVDYKLAGREDNDNIFPDYNNQAGVCDIENFHLIEEQHDKFDEIVDSIENRDLEKLKKSIERLCKYYFFRIKMYFNSLWLLHLAHARSHCVYVIIKPTLQRYSALDATQHLQWNRLYFFNSLREFTLVNSNYRNHQYISVFFCNSSNIVTFVINIKLFCS